MKLVLFPSSGVQFGYGSNYYEQDKGEWIRFYQFLTVGNCGCSAKRIVVLARKILIIELELSL